MQQRGAVGTAGDRHGNRPAPRIDERVEPRREGRRRDRGRRSLRRQPHCSFWVSWISRRRLLVATSGNTCCSFWKVEQASAFWTKCPSAIPSLRRPTARAEKRCGGN